MAALEYLKTLTYLIYDSRKDETLDTIIYNMMMLFNELGVEVRAYPVEKEAKLLIINHDVLSAVKNTLITYANKEIT